MCIRDSNYIVRYLEKNLNVDYQYAFSVDTSTYTTKVNMAIASGDIPDVMNVSYTQLVQLVEADALEDMTEEMCIRDRAVAVRMPVEQRLQRLRVHADPVVLDDEAEHVFHEHNAKPQQAVVLWAVAQAVVDRVFHDGL